MWGGKKARDSRIHVYSSSSSNNRWDKPKTSWTKQDWMKEVADNVYGKHWLGDYDISAKANVDTITVEVWMQIHKDDIPYSQINEDVRSAVRQAVSMTKCPWEVKYDVEIMEK